MEVFFAFLLLAVGLIFILKGGDFLVDSAIWLADISKIPHIIIGATIVSVCTTLPEILVSTISVAIGTQASFSMAVGNAVGTMIFNVLVIVGVCSLISPAKVNRKSFGEKGLILLAVSIILFVFALIDQSLNQVESAILITFFILFMLFNVLDARSQTKQKTNLPDIDAKSLQPENAEIKQNNTKPAWINIALLIVGAAGITIGAKLLVDNVLVISGAFGISEELMGITILAAGTSLPEFVTSILSIKKGTSSLGLGNIIGANIINGTLLLGICGLMAGSGGMPLTESTLLITIPVQIVSTLLLIVPTVLKSKTSKLQGAVMLAVYIAYMTTMIMLMYGII